MNVPLILRDEPFTEPTPVELPETLTVAEFAESVTLADLPSIFDAGYTELAAAAPIGPGYALYSGPPLGTFDLEIGFPVAVVPDGFDAGTFPVGRALAFSHLGGYESLGASWGRLMEHFGASELGEVKFIAEVYTTDPSVTPAADLRTDLFVIY
ncbi:GyrI-like domain-containing protein [Gordonia phosphorivorans]|uniref:GyrI-like domain-containing protein n=1 Tax=Gordonia phosphorivorans TaxID=1056982 RepID=A0ABV6HER8_9ACTN